MSEREIEDLLCEGTRSYMSVSNALRRYRHEVANCAIQAWNAQSASLAAALNVKPEDLGEPQPFYEVNREIDLSTEYAVIGARSDLNGEIKGAKLTIALSSYRSGESFLTDVLLYFKYLNLSSKLGQFIEECIEAHKYRHYFHGEIGLVQRYGNVHCDNNVHSLRSLFEGMLLEMINACRQRPAWIDVPPANRVDR